MLDIDKIRSESQFKWMGVYENLGIDVGTGKHKPCPVCGGKDRFRCDNKKGMGEYICGQCGAGDGFTLVQKVTGMPFIEVAKKVSELIGVVEMDNTEKKPAVDPRKALNVVWKLSSKLTGSDVASRYLHLRKIILTPDNVRFCPKCYESDSKAEVPAMVARIQNRDGKPVSLHRTYLDGTGKKKIMPPTEPLAGAAIRLFQPGGQFEDDVLGVAEGIETACSAAQLNGIATWAVISTSIMAGFEPPEGIRRIIIFGDNDHNYAGQKAAHALANRLFLAGLLVEVEIPPTIGDDWNDVAMKLLS